MPGKGFLSVVHFTLFIPSFCLKAEFTAEQEFQHEVTFGQFKISKFLLSAENKIRDGMKPLLFHLLSCAWSIYIAECNPSTCAIRLDSGQGCDSRPGTCSYGLQAKDYQCLGMKSGDDLDYTLRQLQDVSVRSHAAERNEAFRKRREEGGRPSDYDVDPSDDDDDDDDDGVEKPDDDASSDASNLIDKQHNPENKDHNRFCENGEDTKGEDTRYGIEVLMLTILFLICCCT